MDADAGLPLPALPIVLDWPEGGMKRDMELIRAIARHIHERADVHPRRVEIEGYDDALVQWHVYLLVKEDLLIGSAYQPLATGIPEILVRDFNWQGHELIVPLIHDEWWRGVTKILAPGDMAKASLRAVGAVGTDVVVAWVKSRMGVA